MRHDGVTFPESLHAMLLGNQYELVDQGLYLLFYYVPVLIQALAHQPAVKLIGSLPVPEAIVLRTPHLAMQSPLLAHLAGPHATAPPPGRHDDLSEIWENHFAFLEGPLVMLDQDGATFRLSGIPMSSLRFVVWELARTILPKDHDLLDETAPFCFVMVSGGPQYGEVLLNTPDGLDVSHLTRMPLEQLPAKLAPLHQQVGALPFHMPPGAPPQTAAPGQLPG